MDHLRNALSGMMEKATRPPPAPIDKTLPQQPITKDNLDEYITSAKKFYNMDKPSDFHVAVVGGQGVGKSALINALCNMREGLPGAATVGTSNSEPKTYRSTITEALVLWEMPGAGVGHPSLTYFVDKKLYAFDLIMLVSDRFHRVDFDVARYASQLSRRFIFVRTKADVAVRQICQRQPSSKVEEAFKKLHEEVQASFREGLRLCGLSDKWNSLTLLIVSANRYLDGPSVYSLLDDENVDDDDEEMHKLDEDKLVFHLTTLIRTRAVRRTRTIKQRTMTANRI